MLIYIYNWMCVGVRCSTEEPTEDSLAVVATSIAFLVLALSVMVFGSTIIPSKRSFSFERLQEKEVFQVIYH